MHLSMDSNPGSEVYLLDPLKAEIMCFLVLDQKVKKIEARWSLDQFRTFISESGENFYLGRRSRNQRASVFSAKRLSMRFKSY